MIAASRSVVLVQSSGDVGVDHEDDVGGQKLDRPPFLAFDAAKSH
jgi:hypothetical protein